VRPLFIAVCALAPAALLTTGCADLTRPEQITVVAEKPTPPPAPAAPAAVQANGAMPAQAGQADPARPAGGG